MNGTAPRRYSWEEIILGVLAVIALGALAFLAVKFVKASRFWKRRQEILVVFENVGSLTKDSPVLYNGVEIGRVKDLRPIHLDEKILADRFRPLTRRDINELPIHTDALKRQLLELPDSQFNAACRKEMLGATMIELTLEVLNENDPIRYRLDDEIRIVATVFGDSHVEIISGSGPINDVANQYVLGNSGDFFSNLKNSMGEVKEILNGVTAFVGTEERKSFTKAQRRYTPVNERITKLNKTAAERTKTTLKRYNELTDRAKDKLNEIGKVLEGFQPAAEQATDSIQSALKDIEVKTTQAREEASAAMDDIAKEFTVTKEAIETPVRQVREGIDGIKGGMIAAKEDVERVPERMDAGYDALGSMQSQSVEDLSRTAVSAKKAIVNLKITGFVAKENKDLMLSNRDSGENFGQTALDIHRKLGMASRRIRNAAADLTDAAKDMESDLAADPVIGRAENTVRRLDELRAPIDEARTEVDQSLYRPWTARKRAAWRGEGPLRWTQD